MKHFLVCDAWDLSFDFCGIVFCKEAYHKNLSLCRVVVCFDQVIYFFSQKQHCELASLRHHAETEFLHIVFFQSLGKHVSGPVILLKF